MRTPVALLLPLALLPLAARAAAQAVVLGGLDPVEMLRGNEAAGRPTLFVRHAGHEYRFVREANRDRFREDPSRYAVQWGGRCAADGPFGPPGETSRYWIWGDRLWLLSSQDRLLAFIDAPAAFVEPTPAPWEPDAEARAAGAAALERVAAAVGGGARIDSIDALSVRWAHGSDDAAPTLANTSELTLGAGGALRLRDGERGTYLLNEDGGIAIGDGGTAALAPAQRDELERMASHELWRLLRGRARLAAAPAVASPVGVGPGGGEPDVGDPDPEEPGVDRAVPPAIDVRLGTRVTTLELDPTSGLPRVLRFVGRGGVHGRFGVVRVELDDVREVDGLRLPHLHRVWIDGVRRPTLDRHVLQVRSAAGENARRWFTAPR